jgi:hypothetical protein
LYGLGKAIIKGGKMSLINIFLIIASLLISVISVGELHKLPYPLEYRLRHRIKGKNLKLIFECPFPEAPEKFMVYTVAPELKSSEAYVQVAKGFGKVVKIIEAKKGSSFVKDIAIDINNDGDRDVFLAFHKGRKSFTYLIGKHIRGKGVVKSIDINASDESKFEFAKRFLSSCGLLPKEIRDYKVSYVLCNGIPLKEECSILIYRCLDGVPVVGDDRIHVFFNKFGEIKNIIYNMWDWVKYRKYPIKTPEEAIKELKESDGSGRRYIWINMGTKIVVEKFYLGYYGPHIDSNIEYLQPVYVLEGKDQEMERAFIYIPAVRSEYLEPPIWEKKE